MAERQRVQDNTDLAAASSELQKQAIAFQSQYRQQNMGRDARDAGDVWAQNVGELAGKIGEQFQGRPDLQQRFKAAADEMAMRSYVSGFTYADQEETKYRDATREEKLALLTNAIGTGTPMDIATAKQDYEATLALLYPGRNLQPELMAADRLVAGGLIDRALAEGDIREARALYGEQKDQLGKDAPSYLSKIDAKQEALARKAEADQNKAGREILKGYKDALYKAQFMGDSSDLESMAKQLRAVGLKDNADTVQFEADMWRDARSEALKAAELPLPEAVKMLDDMRREIESSDNVDEHKALSSRAKAVGQVVEQRVKMFKEDPAAAADMAPNFVLPDQATMGDKVSARMDFQLKNGVPGFMVKPLTKAEVENFAMEYGRSHSPAVFVQQMKDELGDSFQPVLKQLVASNKVPASMNLVADMHPDAGDLLAKASGKNWLKETEAALAMEKADKDSLQADITEELEEVTSTILAQGNPQAVATIQDAAYRLALQYRVQGMDDDDAAKKAALEVFAGRYNVRGTFRVPVRYDADLVEEGTVKAVERLAETGDVEIFVPGDSGLTEDAVRRRVATMIKTRGRWVVDENEGGMYLTVGGKEVRNKNGQPVWFGFDVFEGLGKEAPLVRDPFSSSVMGAAFGG
jgi:hypothetical protein